LKDTYQLGQIVRSRCGRDEGKFMVVVGFAGDEYVLIADGVSRKSEKPKLKKIRHIARTNTVSLPIAEILQSGGVVANMLIINELKPFNEKISKEKQGEIN